MTPRYNGKAGRAAMWQSWADKQPIPPWRQNAPERTRDWHNEHVREAKE